MIELVNTPVPDPLVVFVLKAMVGPAEVLQQTPRFVTLSPKLLTIPPLVAVDEVMDVTELVVKRGSPIDVHTGTFELFKINTCPD